jgi:predicted AlkP superfamily pyrophosphatase or phosphodiesterase
MSESLATTLEQTILAQRLMPIPSAWSDEIVFPYYEGLSIRNLAHTIVRLLDARSAPGPLGSAPLDPRLWEHLQGQIRRVVLFVTDGLGWRLFQEIVAEDPIAAQAVADLTGDGSLTPITSVAPSTTAAALPSIWTGASPSATGMVGTQVFLREFGVLASMLHYRPVNGTHRAEVLEDWGLDFETFLPPATLTEVLRARRVPTYLLLQKDLFGSGLSRIMHRGIRRTVRHFGYTDLWIELRNLLHETRRDRCFVKIYWGAVDGISHLFGTVTEETITEIRRQLADLRDTLAAEGVGDGHTLFMLASDHGHTPTPDYVDVTGHAPLVEALRCGLGGEGRFALLYLRHDYRDEVTGYLEAHLGDKVVAVVPSEALRAGLFGPETPYAETGPRLGDLAVITRQGVTLGERPSKPGMPLSRHGGLSDREMLVPLLLRVL